MEKSIEHNEDCYKINLLWKNETKLPNNYPVAKAQLLSLQKRLRKDPEIMQLYEKSLTTYLENNYVKPVTFQYPQLELLWYLPHHPVTNPNKPGKVRRRYLNVQRRVAELLPRNWTWPPEQHVWTSTTIPGKTFGCIGGYWRYVYANRY